MLVIAHRGAGAYAPHNSREAFNLAIAQGADMIETDIRITKDDIPVIYHDAEIPWGPIDRLTWEEINNFQLENGEYLPSLNEILSHYGSKIRFNLEIKPMPLDKIEPIIKVIKKHSISKPLISSFSLEIIKEVNNIGGYETALLIQEKKPYDEIILQMNESNATILNIFYSSLNKKLANLIISNNYQIIAWTNFSTEIRNPFPLYYKAYKLGCTGFITGKPDFLIKFLKFLKKS